MKPACASADFNVMLYTTHFTCQLGMIPQGLEVQLRKNTLMPLNWKFASQPCLACGAIPHSAIIY